MRRALAAPARGRVDYKALCQACCMVHCTACYPRTDAKIWADVPSGPQAQSSSSAGRNDLDRRTELERKLDHDASSLDSALGDTAGQATCQVWDVQCCRSPQPEVVSSEGVCLVWRQHRVV